MRLQALKHIFAQLSETDSNSCHCDACGTQTECNDLKSTTDNEKLCEDCVAECANCDNFGRAEHYFQYQKSPRIIEYYCDDCYHELFGFCEKCEETVPADDIKNSLCNSCGTDCEDCEERALDSRINKVNDQNVCDICLEDHYTVCDECNTYLNYETLGGCEHVEYYNTYFCDDCIRRDFVTCEACDQYVKKSDASEENGVYYHEECFTGEKSPEGDEYLEKFTLPEEMVVTDKDRFLDQVRKLVPISVIELKRKYSRIADGVKDLIRFGQGKEITDELIEAYVNSIDKQEFQLEYSTWRGQQRAVETLPTSEQKEKNIPKQQIVIKVKATKEILARLANEGVDKLFANINETSNRSGHPFCENMLGWARLEISPDNSFILIDEIQSDHMNAIHTLLEMLKGNPGRYSLEDSKRLVENIKQQNSWTDEVMTQKLKNYYNIAAKEFPSIAMNVINKFAKFNGISKIFSIDYETAKEIKNNDPPASLYEALPKKHFFEETQETPFGLRGKFFARLAHEI